MNPSQVAILVRVLIVAAIFAIGALVGGRWVANEKNTAIAEIKRANAEAATKTANAATERLQLAQQRGDALQIRLAKAEEQQQHQAQENAREIKRLTTGRPCLNAGTVWLLNQSSPGIQLSAMPAPVSRAAAADAAFATDTDVAHWIDNARRQYDTCRDRNQALIDWFPPEPQ